MLHNTILRSKRNWTAQEIYQKVINIIESEYSSIWDNQIKIPQLDLYKIWHYDNKNKRTSLKWLEFAMRMPNVEDLPYAVGTNLQDHEKDVTISYCRNDLNATHEFFNKSQKHIKIRQFYTKLEGINLINASETKIAKEVFGKYLSKDMGISYKALKSLRTYRKSIDVKDVIFDYIHFKDSDNIELFEKIRNSKWVDKSEMSKAEAKKNTISFERSYKNIKRVCGEGGIHSFGKAGIYESNEEYMIYDLDFASYYPHLSFKNNLHPEHIPEKVFSNKYEGFYTERKTYPKSDPRNYVLKIILNSSYGLSKDKHTFLYDPKWQIGIVMNGQLLLMMLTEWVVEATSYSKILFENTDGAAFIIKRSEKHLVDEVCKKMEKLSGIALEAQECQRLIMRDVNNYINVIDDNKIKFKGAFEIDRDYHKNHSKRIVPLALANYFINGVVIQDTIDNHFKTKEYQIPIDDKNNYQGYGIYDFCIGSKMKGSNILNARTYLSNKIEDKELHKMNRYYVSKEGVELIKKMPPLEKNYLTSTEVHRNEKDASQLNIFDFIEDKYTVDPSDRETNLEAGWKCTLFNKYKDENDYNINYDYYIKECNKIINSLSK